MKKDNWKKLAFVIALLMCAASLILISSEVYFYRKTSNQILHNARASSAQETAHAANEIDMELRKVEDMVKSIADDLNAGKLRDKGLLSKMKEAVEKHHQIYEIGVAYVPFMHDPKVRLYAPHYGNRNGENGFFQLEKSYDYTNYDWYKYTLEKGPNWFEPYFGKATKSPVTGFAVPIFRIDKEGHKILAGVLRANLSTEKISDLVSYFELGKTGYGFIISKNGYYVSHPVSEVVTGRQTIFQMLEKEHHEQVQDIARKAVNGESGYVEIVDEETSLPVRVCFHPLRSAGWSLGAVIPRDEVTGYAEIFKEIHIRIALAVVVFLASLSFILLHAYEFRRSSLWIVAAIFSALCIAATSYIWNLALTAPLLKDKDHPVLADKAGLSNIISDWTRFKLSSDGKTPVYVPTGILVQTMEFSGANSLKVTGYIWQKYSNGLRGKVSHEFVMPEAETLKITEAYRSQQGNMEVIGWYFEATIREYCDYSKYPFDRPDMWIWIKHKDFDKDVVLVPDLDSYKILNPSVLPGLQEGLHLPGYRLIGAYFDMDFKVSNTNYGIIQYAQGAVTPELYYNVIVRRNFLTPFVTYIFPLLVIIVMLFIVQMKFSKDEAQLKAFGLSGINVLAVVIALLFPTFLAQVNLRNALPVDRITFIENFYFITYFILMVVGVNVYLFTSKRNFPIIDYEECLIPKLLYWPIFTVLVLIVSLINFY
ncbi:MAG: cache domain-containing protein [Firmicutes bacterium]|nr:cache domain-containing protein [Bacillota bacterium]